MNLGDVVVVGAGPAGVRAAETLVQAGLRPVVIDEATRAGGQIYRQPPEGFVRTKQQLYGFESRKADDIHRSFERLAGKIVHLPSTLAWNCDGRRLDLITEGQYASQRFSHLILCTGATDRVLPFPGWLLPGVYTLGAAQVALKAQGCVLGGRVVLAGSGPFLYLLAYQYAKAGAQLAAVLDTASFANQAGAAIDLASQPLTFGKGVYFVAWLRSRGIRVSRGVQDVAVLGGDRVQEVSWRIGDRGHRVACDAVATGFNLRSETQLADLAGCEFDFDPVDRQWLPRRDAAGRSSVAGVYLAGDGVGILGADAAELAGRRAALALLEDVGEPTCDRERERLERALRRSAGFQRGLGRAFPLPVAWLRACPDDLVICRCENVRAGELRRAANDGRATEINRLKALTRVGMGRCQGRMCAGAAAEILACCTGRPVAEVGRLRAQPPIKPISLMPAPAHRPQGQERA